MTIFGIVFRIWIVIFVGAAVKTFDFFIHGIPLSAIDVDFESSFFIGSIVALVSYSIYKLIDAWKGIKSEEFSILMGTFIFSLGVYIFPVGVPYWKAVPISKKEASTLIKTGKNFDSLINKVKKEGKEVIFIEKENYYYLFNPENRFNSFGLVGGLSVKPITYGYYFVDLVDKKLFLMREVKKQNKNVIGFITFITLIWLLLEATYIFIRNKRNQMETVPET